MRPSRSSKFTCMVAVKAQQQWGEQDCKDLTKSDLVFHSLFFCWLKWIFYLLSPRLNCWSKKGKPGIFQDDNRLFTFSKQATGTLDFLSHEVFTHLLGCWCNVNTSRLEAGLEKHLWKWKYRNQVRSVPRVNLNFIFSVVLMCNLWVWLERIVFCFFSDYFRINSDFGVPRLYLELSCLFSSSDFYYFFFFSPTMCMYEFNTMIQFNWRTDIPCQMLGRIHLMLSALLLHKRRLLNIAQQRTL